MKTIRPTGFPEWASQTTTGITEPTDAKKQIGWQTNEKPAAQYANWLEEKQSAWIKYLSYDWLVNDDFIVAPGLINAEAGTGLAVAGNWGVSPAMSGAFYYAADSDGVDPGPLGSINMQTFSNHGLGASAQARIDKYVGNPGLSRDVAFEASVRMLTLSEGSIHRRIRVGAIGAATGEAYFMPTALSASGGTGPGSWWFFLGASLGITGVNLGITENPSAYQRLSYERVGQTMLVQIDGQSRLALYAGNVNFTGTRIGIAMDPQAGVSFSYNNIFFDFIKFGVRRS